MELSRYITVTITALAMALRSRCPGFTGAKLAAHPAVCDRYLPVTLRYVGGIGLLEVLQRGIQLNGSATTGPGELFARAGDLSTAIQ